jgi:hypothetical protein
LLLQVGFAFLFASPLFRFMLLAALFVFFLALLGLFFGFLLGCFLHDGCGLVGFLLGEASGRGSVMHRAFAVGANSDGVSGMASEDDQGGLGVGAWRLGVRVVGRVEFSVGVLRENARALFLRRPPRRVDLHKMRTCGKFPVDMRRNFGLIAQTVEALCGIWATGKYFLLARRRASRVRA